MARSSGEVGRILGEEPLGGLGVAEDGGEGLVEFVGEGPREFTEHGDPGHVGKFVALACEQFLGPLRSSISRCIRSISATSERRQARVRHQAALAPTAVSSTPNAPRNVRVCQ